jgi:hypothetical protein
VEPRISGKEATQVADDMAKRGPIRLMAPNVVWHLQPDLESQAAVGQQ